MKFLIAGLGSIGSRHLRNLISLGEQDILLYRTKMSDSLQDAYTHFPVEGDLPSALAHRPDAVIVSNPTSLHLQVAVPAAEAGCHILLEKPVSYNLEGIEKLRSAVQLGGGQILVGYQFRFHPGLRKIKKLLEDGIIGKPFSVRAHWGEYLPNWHPWEDYRMGYSARSDLGGGVILTLSHPIDYLRWLLGDIQSLWAFSGRLSNLEIDVEDVAEIGLKFANKTMGSIHLDYNQQPSSHRLEIVGSMGTIRWDNSNGNVQLYQAENETWQTFNPPEEFTRNDLFMSEMKHFINVVRNLEKPVCTLEDGIAALHVAVASLQSSDTGKLVSLTESPS